MKRRTFLQSLMALPFVASLFGASGAKPIFANPEIPSAGEPLYFRVQVGDFSGNWSDVGKYNPKTGEILNG